MDVDSSDLCLKDLEKQLAGADVLVAPSGNADLLAYVYTQFAPSLGKKIAQRVKDKNRHQVPPRLSLKQPPG